MRLQNDPYTKTLQGTAHYVASTEEKRDIILQAVLKEAGVEDPISYQEALQLLEGKTAQPKVVAFPSRIAICAAGLAAVAAALMIAPNLPYVSAPQMDTSLLVIPDENVPLSAMPDNGYYEMITDESGAYSIRIFDSEGKVAAWVLVDSRKDGSPVLDGCWMAENQVRFVVNEVFTDIRWESAFAMDQDGNQVDPQEILPHENTLVFQAPERSLDLYLLDNAGNWWTCIFTAEN